jgi:hypothetical protein
MEKKNNNTLKNLAILLFCPPCFSMTLLAIAIGAPLDVILWMASGPLLIMGVAAFVVILDRHAIWGLTPEARQPKTNVWRRATNVWRRALFEEDPAKGGGGNLLPTALRLAIRGHCPNSRGWRLRSRAAQRQYRPIRGLCPTSRATRRPLGSRSERENPSAWFRPFRVPAAPEAEPVGGPLARSFRCSFAFFPQNPPGAGHGRPRQPDCAAF